MTETASTGAGTLKLGGDLKVSRLGFGAMRLCGPGVGGGPEDPRAAGGGGRGTGSGALPRAGPGVWGQPEQPRAAEAVLRRAVELGINLIDTADAYGPEVNERQTSSALHPSAQHLATATQ